ncbi:E1-E2 ATPase-domain-containing protein [Lactarius vividus]|nr:E1-E2 ATPase-domain-containing protein [Lactarius vividus]
MSEYTHTHQAGPSPTSHVASPSATAPPRDGIQCRADQHHRMTREREVEQDVILSGHTLDGQSGCQRPTESPASCRSSTFHFGQAQASSCGSNIDVNCSTADVSSSLDSQSTHPNPGSAAGSDCCRSNTLRHVSQSGQLCRINTGPTSNNTVNTVSCGASYSELDEDRFAVSEKVAELGGGQNQTLLLSIQGISCPCCAHKASLTYKEGIIEPGKIAKRTTELTGYACAVSSDHLKGSPKILRIALPAVSGSSTKVPKLPFGVEILNTSSTTSGTILDVQYNPMIVAPRTVVDSFAAIGGEIYNLFIRTLISFILCIPVLVFSWAPIQPHPIIYGAISLFLATCIQICAGGPLYSTAFRTLFLQHTLDTDALVILSSTIAYLFSFIAYVVQVTGHEFNTPFFETPALLLTLISIGELIGLYARRRATSALDSLGTLQPDYVQLVTSDGSITVIHAELTQSNDILRVSADTLVPTDGIVIRGMTQVDESALTGESLPVDKDRGAPLTAGTRNVTCSVDMKVIRVPAENTIAEISALVARLQEARLSIQDLADRAAGWLGPVILVVAIIVFVVWIIVGLRVRNENLNHAGLGALRYTIAVLVVSCPCAIVLCVPMVIVITGAVAAREGVLFKTAIATQCVKDTTVAVFDKTGTLTLGEMAVVEAHINRQDSVETILSLVSKSSHPVAQSIAKYLRATYPHCEDPSLDKVQSILGKGLEMTTSDGVLIRGGSPSWLGLQADPLYSSMMTKALSMFAVTFDDELVGFFGLTDLPRPSAGAAVRLLQAQGIQVHIVSGDATPVVHALAAQLGVLPEFAHGGCLPAEKVTHVQELQASGGRVLFIGDGTNDTPALAAADVSVAMGGGTDVARDTADIVFLAPDLERALGVLLRLSRGAVLRVYINCVWACVYNLFAVLLAAGAFVHVRIAPEYAGFGEMVALECPTRAYPYAAVFSFSLLRALELDLGSAYDNFSFESGYSMSEDAPMYTMF